MLYAQLPEFMGDSTIGWKRLPRAAAPANTGKSVRRGNGFHVAELVVRANYKAAYCMAVCPAGEDVIAPFLTDRKRFLEDVVQPLQNKPETIYVVPNSDPEEYVARRYPHKKTKRVANGLAGQGSVRNFLRGLPFVFQRGRSEGLNATYHFTFTGQERTEGHRRDSEQNAPSFRRPHGHSNLRLIADSQRGSASCEGSQSRLGPAPAKDSNPGNRPALCWPWPLFPVVAIGLRNGSI